MCLCAWSDQSDTAQHQPELSPCLSLPLWQGILKLKTEGLSEADIFIILHCGNVYSDLLWGISVLIFFFF